MTFPYFMQQNRACFPHNSLMDYEVTFIGEIRKEATTSLMKVVVPVTSLCPCSKQVSAYGAHNQRSHMSISDSRAIVLSGSKI